jgi:hypothetical protein
VAGSEEEKEERIGTAGQDRAYSLWDDAAGGDDAGRVGAAYADGVACEAAVVAGQRRRRGRRRGVVAVGAVGVQGQGGADREAEDGGPGEGVRAPRTRRGGVKAPRLHQAGTYVSQLLVARPALNLVHS